MNPKWKLPKKGIVIADQPEGYYDYTDDDFPGYIQVKEKKDSLEFRCRCELKGRVPKDRPEWRDDFIPGHKTITVKCKNCQTMFEVYKCESWLALQWKDNKVPARSPACVFSREQYSELINDNKVEVTRVNEDGIE